MQSLNRASRDVQQDTLIINAPTGNYPINLSWTIVTICRAKETRGRAAARMQRGFNELVGLSTFEGKSHERHVNANIFRSGKQDMSIQMHARVHGLYTIGSGYLDTK